MINLLPYTSKQAITYAHRNTKLVGIIAGLCIGIIGIICVVVGGLLYLQQEASIYQDSIRTTETSLKQQNEQETIERVQEISNSIKLVVNVLSQEILFSKLLRQVGAQMPPNTVLQDLKLSSELSGALDLQIGALDYNSASQVQVNLMNSRGDLFEKADLVNVTCKQSGDNSDSTYPCQASLRATFNKDSDFTLLNNTDVGDSL